MLPKIALVKSAIESLYDASADIYTYQPTVGDDGISRDSPKIFKSGIRCRINFQSVPATKDTDTADMLTVMITMYYDGSAVSIPTGSLIKVTWDDGRTDEFKNAGYQAVYVNHSEIQLERVLVHP
jgi:hypothetical protein